MRNPAPVLGRIASGRGPTRERQGPAQWTETLLAQSREAGRFGRPEHAQTMRDGHWVGPESAEPVYRPTRESRAEYRGRRRQDTQHNPRSRTAFAVLPR